MSSNTPSSQESGKTEQSSVPVRPAITLTPVKAHVTTTTHAQQPSEGPSLPAVPTNEVCHRTSGGSLQCLPKSSLAVERAPHTPVTAEQFLPPVKRGP